MGQQQLLLLVLSTVIVGLATVAGIQAFSENQAQASQDALVQRGTSIASDIKGLQGKPNQLGGIDLVGNTPGSNEIARKVGLENNPFKAQGAGSNSYCQIAENASGDEAHVQCVSDDAPQDVQVTYNAANDEVTTDFNQSFSISSTTSI
jgi:hypothetical protein